MSKIKLLSIIIIVLLITNLALISFLFFGKVRHPNPMEKKYIVIEKLHFDGSQIIEFEKLIDMHQTEIREVDNQIRILKNKLYNTLVYDTIPGFRDSLITEIGKKQMKIETIHLNHFTQVKKLCKPEQEAAFKDFTSELSKFLSPPPRPQRENKK